MIISENKEQIDYLYDKKIKKIEPVPKRKMAIEFVKSFNREAKRQKSEWFAKIDYCKSFIDGRKFILLHIHKKRFFKDIISLHIGCYEHHYSFVENDYLLTDYGKEKSDKIFKLLPEISPILENLPQVFFILKQEESSREHMEKMIAGIKKELNLLKNDKEKETKKIL